MKETWGNLLWGKGLERGFPPQKKQSTRKEGPFLPPLSYQVVRPRIAEVMLLPPWLQCQCIRDRTEPRALGNTELETVSHAWGLPVSEFLVMSDNKFVYHVSLIWSRSSVTWRGKHLNRWKQKKLAKWRLVRFTTIKVKRPWRRRFLWKEYGRSMRQTLQGTPPGVGAMCWRCGRKALSTGQIEAIYFKMHWIYEIAKLL